MGLLGPYPDWLARDIYYWDHSLSIKLHPGVTLTPVGVVAAGASCFCPYLTLYTPGWVIFLAFLFPFLLGSDHLLTEDGDRISLTGGACYRALTIVAGNISDPIVLRRILRYYASNCGHISGVYWAESKTAPHSWQPGCTSAPILCRYSSKYPCLMMQSTRNFRMNAFRTTSISALSMEPLSAKAIISHSYWKSLSSSSGRDFIASLKAI